MSFLEAMHLNCCVVAHDMSTHNEYINNGVNGLLTDFHNPSMQIQLNSEEIRRIASNAQKDSFNWRNLWITHYKKLAVDSIKDYVNNFQPDISSVNVKRFSRLNLLANAHEDWNKYWATLQLRNRFLRDKTKESSTLKKIHQLELDRNYNEALKLLDELASETSFEFYSTCKSRLVQRMNFKENT